MNSVPCNRCGCTANQIVQNPQHTVYRCTVCRGLTEINHIPQTIKPRFSCFGHQGKELPLVNALQDAYELVSTNTPHYFCLTDSDVSGRMAQMKRMELRGIRRFFVYPHAARPSLINSMYPTWEGTTAQFVVNDYHAEVLRAYGYEKPLETMGWHLSPVEDFKPRDTSGRAVNVLFAPVHPRNTEIDRTMNAATFERLIAHVQTGEINLTVRHIGEIQEGGLAYVGGVQYVRGEMNQATKDMDAADVVIGHQTFAWLAVARGIPCVMFAEDMPTHFRLNNKYHDAPCWKSVHHLFRYPLDILCVDDTMKLLRRAAQSDDEIADWRRRMIGSPFDPAGFAEKVGKYL